MKSSRKAWMGLRRGDIVWARVLYPKKWWPGLISSIDGHNVAVSFFNDAENPSYFLETEVRSFTDNFESLIKTLNNCTRGEELLDKALKLLARRITSSLKCPCHFRTSPKEREISRRSRIRSGDSFQPNALLNFVAGLAVSPCVGDIDLVNAVTVAAQLNAFRRYVIGEQKVFLDPKATKKLQGSDECSTLSPLPTTAQKSDASELKFETMNGDQSNSGLLVQIDQTKTQSLHVMPVRLRCLTSSENHLSEGCLNTVKQNYIRNLECQTILNFEVKKCSGSKLQSSHQSVKINGKDCRNIFSPPKPFVASPTVFLGLKRQYDHSVDSDFCSKLCKTMPLFSIRGVDADLQKSKSGRNVYELDALISLPSSSFSCCMYAPMQIIRTGCEENDPDSFSGAQLDVGLIDQACIETRNHLHSSTAADQIQTEHSSCVHNVCVETNRQESITEAFRESSVGNNPLLPLVTSDSFRSESQLQVGLTDRASAETRNYLLSPTTTDQIHMEHRIGNHNVSVEINRRESINVASRVNSMENKSLLPVVTSDTSSSMPQVAQQSSERVYSDCQYLYMKFPRNFILPSKKDLIRKFIRFGKIDLFRTKIFERMGSAQVVFLRPLDAVAAYQYSKRKKILFGEPNVHFWLDPYEKKRSGSKHVIPMPNLKSCLKNSDMRGQGKKNSKKVRFLMQT